MADTTAPAPNPNVELLTAIFPHIPENALRQALDVTGSAELASSWLLENDWRELQAGAQQAAAAAAGGHGAGADDDDDDDDDGDGDGDGDDGAARAEEPPAKRQRKVVTQASGSAAAEGATSFWCAFDETCVHKGHLQLMNLRPKSLGHSRIALWTETAASSDRGAAERSLGDVWTHCVPEADPGYWLVPLQMGDLDDVWWKILEPHLIQKKFGSAVVLQTLAPKSGALRGAGAARAASAVAAAPAFDELEARAAEAARARAHAGPRYGGARAAAPDAASAVVACVVVLSSGAAEELSRVGEFLGALFPTKCPLHFRRLKSTATEAGPAGSKHAAFAHDPRADPAVLQPEWHEKHADFRVKKTVDAPPAKPPGGLFAAHAQKRVKFDVERRTDDRASEWSPLDAK